MNEKKFDRLYQHYVKYFNATEEPRIFHPHTEAGQLHVDIVLIKPSEAFPFQVLATIGASDVRLKKDPRTISDRNEYVTFVPADWDMTAPENCWVLNLLGTTAHYRRVKSSLSSAVSAISSSPSKAGWVLRRRSMDRILCTMGRCTSASTSSTV